MGSEATRDRQTHNRLGSLPGSDGQPARENTALHRLQSGTCGCPKAYTLKTPTAGDILNDTQEIWEIHILDGAWILATKLDNVHGMLPILVAQTTKDSLSYNTTGPMQVQFLAEDSQATYGSGFWQVRIRPSATGPSTTRIIWTRQLSTLAFQKPRSS